MRPPSTGPSATPSPAMDDQSPSAACGARGGKAAESSVSVSGISSAAPSALDGARGDELREVVESAPAAGGRA